MLYLRGLPKSRELLVKKNGKRKKNPTGHAKNLKSGLWLTVILAKCMYVN